MQERVTLALVLSFEQTGERDGRVVLYTEHDGKVVARARSLYAPRAKLVSHLQPGTISLVRLVEKKGVQIVDALVQKRLIAGSTETIKAVEYLAILTMLAELTHPNQPDPALWRVIEQGRLASRELLRILGFDAAHAQCQGCEKLQPSYFLLRDLSYICKGCFSALKNQRVVVV